MKSSPLLFDLSIYRIKIVLIGSKPLVWRRILVKSDIKLGKLHRLLQIVMGWENAHLHEFRVGKVSFGEPDPDYESTMLDEENVQLRSIMQDAKDRIRYIYDFGDGWQHDLILEQALPAKEGERYPVCLAGQRACPLEDSGGIWGYALLLKALARPETREDRDLVSWAGDFDPNEFELDAINARLKRMR